MCMQRPAVGIRGLDHSCEQIFQKLDSKKRVVIATSLIIGIDKFKTHLGEIVVPTLLPVVERLERVLSTLDLLHGFVKETLHFPGKAS